AILPDFTMFLFYGYQKVVGAEERDIWETLYFQEHWQIFFDVFNSIPVYGFLAIICYFCGWRISFLLCASALLHVVCDLPVHHDDAHRHFLPFTNWKLISPISYWDPEHYGLPFALAESLSAISVCIYLVRKSYARSIKVAAGINLLLYTLAIVLGLFVYWKVYYA
ncbi:MAG: hypothetical protein AAGA30_13235, partial [Planctomycetota bacterium]